MCKAFLLVLVAGYCSIQQLHSQCLGSCCSAANASGISSQLNIPKEHEWMIGASLLTMQYQPLTDEELLLFAAADQPVYSI
ncbi:MAG TPA: hypothetical protein PLD84_12165, partial [Chitinophagales bacterium]|nr:hypothetical protein [Chitinophagales bacterium]